MRVLTYNVRSLKQDRVAVVEIVRSVDPDVLALQEPPKWWRGGARLRRLATDCGLEVVVPGGLLGARTCAVLVRPGTTVVSRRALRLPLRVRGREHRYPTLRGAALVVLDVSGFDASRSVARSVLVASLHLSLDPRERAEHLRRIEEATASLADAAGLGWDRVVVAGDLNEPPDGPSWRALERRGLHDLDVDDLPTFSTTDPRRRLDVIFAASGMSGAAWRVGGERVNTPPAEHSSTGAEDAPASSSEAFSMSVAAGSDHFPVVSDIVAV